MMRCDFCKSRAAITAGTVGHASRQGSNSARLKAARTQSAPPDRIRAVLFGAAWSSRVALALMVD